MSQQHRTLRLLAAGVLGLLLAVPPVASARQTTAPGAPGASQIARGERPVPTPQDVPARLLVTWKSGTAAAARSALARRHGLARAGTLPHAEVLTTAGGPPQAAAAALRADPAVKSVRIDPHRAILDNPTGEPAWRWQWGHHNVGQVVEGRPSVADVDVDGHEALAVTGGSASVVVAVIDDGVDFGHPELAGRAWVNPGESGVVEGVDRRTNGVDDDGNGYVDDVHGWDFCHDDNTVHDFDNDSHGTAVAGTIAASIDGRGSSGVAPRTSVMALKFLQDPYDEANPWSPACGWDDQAIEAIAYAKSFGVRIINASWGGPVPGAELEAAIEGSGALFVTAAGNDGVDIDDTSSATPASYPAGFDSPNILTVAAIHSQGGLADFSNYGARSVDVAAPGEQILAPCPEETIDGTVWPAGTCWWNGTSFSAPYATGIAALVGAVRPDLLASPLLVRGRLVNSAVPLAGAAGKTASGRLLNARRAIDFTKPVLGGGLSVLPTASSIGLASVRTRLSWNAATDDLAMASYRVEQRRNGGAWTVVTKATTARSLELVIALSGTYQFQVMPRDALGNLGPPLVSRIVSPLRYEEASTGVKYSGTWAGASSTSASGGRTRFTTVSGATATLTFQGRTVALVAPTGPTRSSFKVYLDGVYIKTVSLYSSTTKSRLVVFTTGTLASKTHTLKLVHARVGSRIRGEIDAFVVLR